MTRRSTRHPHPGPTRRPIRRSSLAPRAEARAPIRACGSRMRCEPPHPAREVRGDPVLRGRHVPSQTTGTRSRATTRASKRRRPIEPRRPRSRFLAPLFPRERVMIRSRDCAVPGSRSVGRTSCVGTRQTWASGAPGRRVARVTIGIAKGRVQLHSALSAADGGGAEQSASYPAFDVRPVSRRALTGNSTAGRPVPRDSRTYRQVSCPESASPRRCGLPGRQCPRVPSALPPPALEPRWLT